MTNPIDKQQYTKGHLHMLAVIAVFIIPMLISYLLYYQIETGGSVWGTNNKGHLLRPAIPLKNLALILENSETLNLKSLQGKWTLAYWMPSICDKICETDIYHMRQIHLLTNKDMQRVQRLAILQYPDQQRKKWAFLQHYNDMWIIHKDISKPSVRQQITPTNQQVDGHIYIIDPHGNVMMRYPAGVKPQAVHKDLKKLLKISRVG